ncbi:MAG: glycosyltransferase family 39 protein [Chloroflexota bacterium]
MPLVVSPVGEFAVDDDWTYAQAVQHLVETGAYHRSVWIDTAFVAQAWWGAAISKLLGFSLTGLRLGTLVLAAVALVLFYRLLLRLVSPAVALGATLLLLFHPIFLHLAYTFMTDVPFLTVMLAAVWCLTVALEGARAAPAGRVRLGWLAAGSAMVGLACLVRQVGIALAPAVLLGALPELYAAWVTPARRLTGVRTSRAQSLRHRLQLLAALLVPCSLVVVLLAYADPGDVGVEVRFADIWQAATLADLVGVALKETALASLLLGLSAAPAVVALWLPRGWRVWRGRRGWRTWQYGLASLLLLILGGILWRRASLVTDWLAALSPLFGNTLSSSGLTVSGLHPRAISVDTTTLTVLVGAALLGAAGLVLAVVELAGQVTGKPHPQPLPIAMERGR